MQYFSVVSVDQQNCIVGKLTPKINAPADYEDFQDPYSRHLDPTRQVQIELTVSTKTQVFIQLLLDCPVENRKSQWVNLNIYEVPDDIEFNESKVNSDHNDLYYLYKDNRVRFICFTF